MLQHREALEAYRDTAYSWLFEMPDFSFLNGKPLGEYLLRLGEILESPEPITWDMVDVMKMRFKKLKRLYTGSRDSDSLGCEVVEASGADSSHVSMWNCSGGEGGSGGEAVSTQSGPASGSLPRIDVVANSRAAVPVRRRIRKKFK